MKEQFTYFWNHSWALAISAGILLGFSFPPFDVAVFQFPALIFLFRVAELCSTRREILIKVYSAFLIWNVMTTYWLMMATLPGGVAAILANALLMLIPFMLIHSLLNRGFHPLATALLAASVWVSYEFLHHNWDLAWPWLTLGNGWSNFPSLIQYISITGHLGISFWVVAVSVMGTLAIRAPGRKLFAQSALLILFFPVISLISLVTYEESTSDEIEVAVIQPNLDSYLDFGGLESTDEVLDLLLELSDSVRTGNTALIVWPENAIESAIAQDNRFNRRIRDSLDHWNSELITGAGLIEYYDEGDEPRLVRGRAGSRSFNIFNAALHYNDSVLPDIYKKGKLVPVVERIPYVEALDRIDLFSLVDWGEIAGYGKGTEAKNFRTGGHLTPALICYDSVYPQWTSEFVQNGAEFLTIITNDGWWGKTSGHLQHFAYARLRAIEFRHWIVRSANNGISGIISPDGSVLLETGYWERTAFTYTIHPVQEKTVFVRYGNWFNRLMLAGALFSLILLYRTRRE